MEFLFIVIGIVIFVSNLSKRAREQQNKSRRNPTLRPLNQRNMHADDAAPAYTWDMASGTFLPTHESTEIEQDAYHDLHEFGEGDSRSDGYDIGGSLPHTTHQGVEFHHEAAHKTVRPKHVEEEIVRAPRRGHKYKPESMQQAIVLSEILGKPVSMRK